MRKPVAWAPSVSVACCLVLGVAPIGHAQEEPAAGLTNGGFEEVGESGVPEAWHFVARPDVGQTLSIIESEVAEGDRGVVLRAPSGNEFTNLMQAFDASDWKGQRARLRAAIKTADLDASSRVQMWFRVDNETGMGAFDNMQDRPVTDASWEYHDIVLDVGDDATRLNVGLFVIGSGTAWLDDVTLEVVDEEVVTTSMIDASVWAAAAEAPVQPFYNHWLWLAALAIGLFASSHMGLGGAESSRPLLARFALRFTIVYWILYSFPLLIGTVSLGSLSWLTSLYSDARDAVIRWTGARVFAIEGELVAPNGSGDTTYAYISLFVGFSLAIVAAAVWTALERGGSRDRDWHDLLRSYLRYVLAATMLGYGLAKIGDVMNQFPMPREASLGRTYGESSPMGLLWTFMGASRAYTTFGGLAEVLGGVLLLTRRTTTLGALVVIGVMTNVVLLNFAYDVPVKQYSVHIVLMAAVLLLPEWRRLLNVFVLRRATEPGVERAAFVLGPKTLWTRRVLKTVLILTVGVAPIVMDVWREVQAPSPAVPEAESEHLLIERGFRWINEVPFNR